MNFESHDHYQNLVVNKNEIIKMDEKNKLTIIDNSQLMDLNENLFKFKNECLFTDIYIYVDGVEFPCHKVILCAASNYFKAMFSCDLKESRLGKVFIENISPWTMKRLLDYIYTGKIEINYDNVIDIFNAAVMFQLFKLVDKCTDYIQQHIDINNCIDINLFASMHNLIKLENDTFQFILENFMQLINLNSKNDNNNHQIQVQENNENKTQEEEHQTTKLNNDFVKLNEKTFIDLIKSDSLNVRREIYVYYALNKWIEHYETFNNNANNNSNNSKIGQMYENLFKYLRLNALSYEELEFIALNDKYVQQNKSLQNQIKKLLNNKLEDDNCTIFQENNSKQEKFTVIDDFIENLKITSSETSQKTSTKINPRPSTIPREYLCFLNLDQFQFYDFFKSKWDCLNSFPSPQLNKTNAVQSPSTKIVNLNKTRLNGYSTCIVNNILYIIGGHLLPYNLNETYHQSSNLSSKSTSESSSLYSSSTSLSPNDSSPIDTNTNLLHLNNSQTNFHPINLNQMDLVDTMYKFDPIKNEWSLCKEMLHKRAFHTSVVLTNNSNGINSSSQTIMNNRQQISAQQILASSKNEKLSNYIFLFYGICYDSNHPSLLVQCLSIDFYNIETDQWSVLNLNNSLLNHHIYQSFNQYSRNIQNQLEHENSDENNSTTETNNNNNNQEENLQLKNLINLQLTQAKSILTLRNILYILNQNCIHCYEFNSKQSQLICLPYFQLPINLNKFILAKAIAVKDESKSSSCMSLFSWYSCSNSEDIDTNDYDEEGNRKSLTEQSEVLSNDNGEEDEDDQEYLRNLILNKNKREALIYLLNPQQGIIYEFYPAKNKLLKLPNLCLKHFSPETFILKIKSKLYVTGGVYDQYEHQQQQPNSTDTNSSQNNQNAAAIEVFNEETNSWSIFMNKLDNLTSSNRILLSSPNSNNNTRAQSISITKNYLNLKMSLFH